MQKKIFRSFNYLKGKVYMIIQNILTDYKIKRTNLINKNKKNNNVNSINVGYDYKYLNSNISFTAKNPRKDKHKVIAHIIKAANVHNGKKKFAFSDEDTKMILDFISSTEKDKDIIMAETKLAYDEYIAIYKYHLDEFLFIFNDAKNKAGVGDSENFEISCNDRKFKYDKNVLEEYSNNGKLVRKIVFENNKVVSFFDAVNNITYISNKGNGISEVIKEFDSGVSKNTLTYIFKNGKPSKYIDKMVNYKGDSLNTLSEFTFEYNDDFSGFKNQKYMFINYDIEGKLNKTNMPNSESKIEIITPSSIYAYDFKENVFK